MGGTQPDALSSPGQPPRAARQAVRPRRGSAGARGAGGCSISKDQPRHRRGARSRPADRRGAPELRAPGRAGADRRAAEEGRRDAWKAAVAPLATSPRCGSWCRTSSASSTRSSMSSPRTSCSPTRPGFAPEAKDKARALVVSFEKFLEEHKDEIDALQFFYLGAAPGAAALQGHQGAGRGHHRARRGRGPPRSCGAPTSCSRRTRCGARPGQRLLTDIVSLVRFALHQDGELGRIPRRCASASIELDGAAGQPGPEVHGPSRCAWLEMMRDHVGDERGDRGGRLRLHAVRPGGRARQGACRCSARSWV